MTTLQLPIEPVTPSRVRSLIEGNNADLIRQVANLYLSPSDRIADLTYGKGVFWRQCPELNVTGSDIATVPERPYDFTATPYENDSFDVVALDPPYIHSWSTHQTEARYRGSTTHATSMAGIWELYRKGMVEAKRILCPGGLLLLKTKDTVESGKQRWSHIHLANTANELGFYLRDLFILQTAPPCERRWDGLTQKHSRKNVSYLLVLEVAS